MVRERIAKSIANIHYLNFKALLVNVWGSLAPLIVVKGDAPLSWLDNEAGAVTDDITGRLPSRCSRTIRFTSIVHKNSSPMYTVQVAY